MAKLGWPTPIATTDMPGEAPGFHPARGTWHELDGFLVRRGERVGWARKMRTVEKRVLSDHKPKMLEVRIDPRRWRAQGGGGEEEAEDKMGAVGKDGGSRGVSQKGGVGWARKMRTVEKRVLSDHKPKMLEVRIDPRRWRAQGGGGG